MGFYAKINENKVVTEIIYVDSDSDANAITYLEDIVKLEGPWVRARNASNSLNHADLGLVYIDHLDAFMPPKPFESWVIAHNLNSLNYFWKAPVDHPGDGKKYRWDEEALNWVLDTEAE